MSFKITPNMQIRKDKKGILRAIRHSEYPYYSKEKYPPTPHIIAKEYIQEVAHLYEIEELIDQLDRPFERKITEEKARLFFLSEKAIDETHILVYQQSCYGIPIWGSSFTIYLQKSPLRVIRSQNKLHYETKEIKSPKRDAKYLPGSDLIASRLRELAEKIDAELIRIDLQKLWFYRYYSKDRQLKKPDKQIPLASIPITVSLKPVPPNVQEGEYYPITEVEFILKTQKSKDIKWRAFIHTEDGTILRIRAELYSMDAKVFIVDPITASGDDSLIPESDTDYKKTRLNNRRDDVQLQGLNPSTPQELSGDYVEIVDILTPPTAPPTVSGTDKFIYDVWTDDFAAVNAYYHIDTYIRYVKDLGLDVNHFFGNLSTFPIQADHRSSWFSLANMVNAFFNPGDLSLNFMLANSNDTIGIAVDARFVIHELSHLILWNQRGDDAFIDFSHSHGDSLAILYCDPKGSWLYQLDDTLRYRTFPFIHEQLSDDQKRYHNRSVLDGFAWGDFEPFDPEDDNNGYNSEQILSTTLFRLYLSMGGDDNDRERQQLASDYITYLIFKATSRIGPLSNGKINVEDFVDDMILFDYYPTSFHRVMISQSGSIGVTQLVITPFLTDGCAKKVIRWSFEKQGLYDGFPPDVDVYINDGRDGNYYYDYNPETRDIWNRLHDDGGLEHEFPQVGEKNYVYVKINNRGTEKSTEVYVKGWQSPSGVGLTWPDDFKPLETEELAYYAGIMPDEEVVVGPFEWIPEKFDDQVLISVSSLKDPSIIDRKRFLPSFPQPTPLQLFTPSWPLWRLILLDNNIAIWSHPLFEVFIPDIEKTLKDFIYAFRAIDIDIWNPFDQSVHVEIIPEFHKQFSLRGWQLKFLNTGMSSFTLGPRVSRKVKFKIEPGELFSGKLNEELKEFLAQIPKEERLKDKEVEIGKKLIKRKPRELGFRIIGKAIFLDFLRLKVWLNNFPIGQKDYSIRLKKSNFNI